jgi:hypothetical protein
VKKVIELTIQELYNKPKITASIEEAIRQKEDFSQVQYEYCSKVCKLKCKSFENVQLEHGRVDVLIIQDHSALPDKWKEASKLERTYKEIIHGFCRTNLRGLTYRVTNALKCQIQKEDMVKGKPPTVVTQSKCHPYVRKEIELAQPKVIISLGNNATKALGITHKSNYTNRGEIINGNVVLTLHPKVTTMIRQNSSGKMWGSDYYDVINRDFEKAGRIARGELVIPSLQEGLERQKENIFIARSIEDVKAFVKELQNLPTSKLISFDIETTGLDRYAPDAKIIVIQLGYRIDEKRKKAFVIPLWHRENTFYNPDEAWIYIVPILESEQPKVGHNGKYDILYIYETKGVRVKNVITDTMLAMHNLSSGIQGCYSLKTAVWDYLPELGIGGYEDLLPKLTRVKEETEDDVA